MRLRLVLLIACVLVFAGASPASAAPPSNDQIAGAIPVTLPFSESRDTTEATTDADDAALNENCGAPATDASVWYAFSPTEEVFVAVDVSQSDYTAGVLVGAGSPGSLSLVTCGPGGVAFSAELGTTYFILAIDDQFDGGGNGGTLNITIDVPPPPPAVSVSVDRTGRFNPQTGEAVVSGTFTCEGTADFTGIDVSLRQNVGRFSVQGWGGVFDLPCDGTTQTWSAQIHPDNGKFAGGRATAAVFAFACGPFACGDAQQERVVTLRK